MYCLYPNETLVVNTGFDGSGTHCETAKANIRKTVNHKVNVLWQEPQECKEAWNEYKKHFKRMKTSFIRRCLGKIKRMIIK